MLSLLSVSVLRSRFVDFSFSFSCQCNSVSVSVSCLGFFVMNSVTGPVGVSVSVFHLVINRWVVPLGGVKCH